MKEINSDAFKDEVLNSDMPVVVDFFATWCGPCKMIAPILDELSSEYEGKAKIVKVDVDQSKELAIEYGIRSVPTLIFFKNGEISDKVTNVLPKDELASKIEAFI